MPFFRKKSVWEIFCTLVLAGIYGRFAYNFADALMVNPNLSGFMYLVFDSIVVCFVLTRAAPSRTSPSVTYWAIAMLGTWSSLLFNPLPDTPGMSVFLIPQLIGMCISFAGFLSLNRSFGLLASNRGIRTGGIYRYMRHPLYASYILSGASFLLQHISLWNVAIFTLQAVMEIARIFIEEDFLKTDEAYAAYMARVRWRLLPGVW
jgi:protein-S-isoprenylcysteine O-methyltransferase Ste14